MSGTVNRSPRHAEPVDLVSLGEAVPGSLGSEWVIPQRMLGEGAGVGPGRVEEFLQLFCELLLGL